MRACWLAAAVILWGPPCPAQDCPADAQAGRGGPSGVAWKDIVEAQARVHQDTLKAQLDISRSALEASKDASSSFQTFQQFLGACVGLFTIAGGLYGLWLRKTLDRFEDTQLGYQKLRVSLQESEGVTRQLEEKVRSVEGQVGKIQAALTAMGGDERLREQLDDLSRRAELARIRIDLISGNEDERLRAAQLASERAGGELGVRLVPILLDCLRSSHMPSLAVAEALHGLELQGPKIVADREAVELVLDASRSREKAVRLQAVLTIGAMTPMPAAAQTRLRECVQWDVDEEVKTAAAKLLKAQDGARPGS